MTHVLDDPGYWPEQYNAMKRDRDRVLSIHDDFINAMLLNTPEHYDGDDAGTDIAIAYVRHLEEVAAAATTLVEESGHSVRFAASGETWRRLQEALWTVNGTWPA